MKEKVENVHSSSADPNTYITAIFTNLKNSKKTCCQIWEAFEGHQNQMKGLTWNGASIAMATLNCIMILKTLDYMSKTLTNIIGKQILTTCKSKLAYEVFIDSKSFSE